MHSYISNYLREVQTYSTKNLKFDLIASIVVALVAIPLCLGVALASGAPLFSGILSGIVGGIVVGIISNSAVSVSGPAAGMAAVVLAAITQLGSFDAFLLALVIAGILQILTGIFKAGFIADYIPSNVVQGLLCAIGILLILKQLPLAFTLSADFGDLKAHLLNSTKAFSITPLFYLSFHINSGALVISFISFAILILFEKIKKSWLKFIPGPIVAVIISILLNEFLIMNNSYLAQHSQHLVNIPAYSSLKDFMQQTNTPNWQAFTNPSIYMYGIILAIVASLETLLNIKAGEKLDTKRRICSKNRELIAQGIGNVLTAFIGGIPITSVIVRTSVNIQTGARTKYAALFHGLIILIAIATIPTLVNRIPLCTLASILIYTGYKLTKPAIYRSVYEQGMDRFIPFIITVISIVFFNLLEGIIIGLVVSLFFILRSNSKARLDIIKEIYPQGITHRLILPQQTTFLNKAALIDELDALPIKARLIIDARYTDYIDKEIIDFIKDFQQEQAPLKKIAINLIGFKKSYDIHNYVDFINVTTYDIQSVLTPKQVLQILKEGNERFLKDTRLHRSAKTDIQYTAETQHPIAVVLGCIDSRVPVETIFDVSFGDVFCVRVAGNVTNNDVIASIEYACSVVGAKLIVVLGHTRCGAIQAACDGVKKGHITQLLNKIQPAIQAETITQDNRTSKNPSFLSNVTDLNIANTLQHLYLNSPILRDLILQDELGLTGALYDVHTGKVDFKNFHDMMPDINPDTKKDISQLLQKLKDLCN